MCKDKDKDKENNSNNSSNSNNNNGGIGGIGSIYSFTRTFLESSGNNNMYNETPQNLEKILNTEFCKEVGIKQALCYIVNKETGETRFYSSISGAYKKPSGWKKIAVYKFNKPRYPDLINNPYNFTMLLNVQWEMFGEIGDAYKRTGEESFEYNYLKTRLTAIKMCKSFGGGEMLDEYKAVIQSMPFDYINIENEDEDDEDEEEKIK